MPFTQIRPLLSPESLLEELPLPAHLRKITNQRDEILRSILRSESDLFIVIIGPCSADNEDAVTDYCTRLAKVQEKTSEKLYIIPRIYTNKPRTLGTGYKGMLHQPDPSAAPNLVDGIRAIRKMHLRIIAESGMSGADEMLYPGNHTYLGDLLNYVAIGARSSENQQHRLTASGIDLPAGFKNPTSGDIQVMLNSISAAQVSHSFAYNGWEVTTEGNPYAHAILRGAVDKTGKALPNYHFEDILDTIKLYESMPLQNRSIIIDTSHSNSSKKFSEQPRIVHEVLHSRSEAAEIKTHVKGVMIESYLVEGNQETTGTIYGKSITDPCLGWEKTETLLYELADHLTR